jgi:hypothetical protein
VSTLNVNVAEWNPDTGDYSVDLVLDGRPGSVLAAAQFVEPDKARDALVEALEQLDALDAQWAATLDRTTRRTR